MWPYYFKNHITDLASSAIKSLIDSELLSCTIFARIGVGALIYKNILESYKLNIHYLFLAVAYVRRERVT